MLSAFGVIQLCANMVSKEQSNSMPIIEAESDNESQSNGTSMNQNDSLIDDMLILEGELDLADNEDKASELSCSASYKGDECAAFDDVDELEIQGNHTSHQCRNDNKIADEINDGTLHNSFLDNCTSQIIINPEHHLIMTPSSQCLEFNSVGQAKLLIHNPTSSWVAYKVKSTSPEGYAVRPPIGAVPPSCTSCVQLVLNPGYAYRHDDRFMIVAVGVRENPSTKCLKSCFSGYDLNARTKDPARYKFRTRQLVAEVCCSLSNAMPTTDPHKQKCQDMSALPDQQQCDWLVHHHPNDFDETAERSYPKEIALQLQILALYSDINGKLNLLLNERSQSYSTTTTVVRCMRNAQIVHTAVLLSLCVLLLSLLVYVLYNFAIPSKPEEKVAIWTMWGMWEIA